MGFIHSCTESLKCPVCINRRIPFPRIRQAAIYPRCAFARVVKFHDFPEFHSNRSPVGRIFPGKFVGILRTEWLQSFLGWSRYVLPDKASGIRLPKQWPGPFRFRTATCCRRARISVWSAARSAKILMILCMPERVSGGDAKFQGSATDGINGRDSSDGRQSPSSTSFGSKSNSVRKLWRLRGCQRCRCGRRRNRTGGYRDRPRDATQVERAMYRVAQTHLL